MNSRLVLTLVPLAGLLLAGCNKSEPEAAPPAKTAKASPVAEAPPPPVTPPPPPAPSGPSESEMRLAEKMRTMELRQAELQQQLEEEKLARLEAEIAKERDLLEKERRAWALEQELAAAREAPTPAVSKSPAPKAPAYNPGPAYDYQTFYDDLAPHGTWSNSPDYGYIWQPRVYVTDTSWRPYTRGTWNACDSGWMWCSDEPFGWACYHYGRWAKCRHRGWIWIPGDQWAPAWVAWRKNDDYVGWCPLPPETVYHRDYTWGPTVDTDCGIHPSSYVFMPVKHFDKPVLGYCEAPVTCLRICGSTVNVTNIICRPGRVLCEGPRYDWISRCVRRPVPRYEVAFASLHEESNHRAYRIEKDRIHVFAPRMETPWNEILRPHTPVATLEQTEIIRAPSGVPDKLVQRYKTERTQREKAVASAPGKAVRQIVERQQKLVEMEKSRETAALEAQRQAEAAKSKLAAGPPRMEVPGKVPRAVAVEPQQTGGDVSAPGTAVPAPAPVTRERTDRKTAHRTEMEQKRLADEQARAAAQNEEAAKRAAMAAEQLKAAEAAAAAASDANSSREAALEDQRRQLEEARAAQAAQQAAAEAQKANDTSAAARSMDKKTAQRIQMEEARRQQQEAAAAAREADAARTAMAERQQQLEQEAAATAREADAARTAMAERQQQLETERAALAEQKRQAEAQRAAVEQQRHAENVRGSIKDRTRQKDDAREQARAEAQRAAAAEQAARQREEIERQRAVQEQQKQAAAARAEAERQQVMQEQRRQAEAAQREAAQREAALREAAQREAMQREAAEQQRRAAEENAARQREAAEQQRRQAEEQAKQQQEQQERSRKDHKLRGGK